MKICDTKSFKNTGLNMYIHVPLENNMLITAAAQIVLAKTQMRRSISFHLFRKYEPPAVSVA